MAELSPVRQRYDERYLDIDSNNLSTTNAITPAIDQNSVAISHVNIRSLNKNFENLKQLYEDESESKFDIIGISETWNVVNPDALKLSDYNLELKCRGNGKGGGVGAYIRSSINYTRINDFNTHCAESLWLRLNLNKILVIGIVYRKPSSDIHEFMNEMNLILDKMKIDKYSVVILGDFNVNLLSDDEKSCALLNMMECYGLHQLIEVPTRITKSSKTLIDHIYTNIHDYFETGCIEIDVSDHFPVYVLLKMVNNHVLQQKKIKCRNYKHFQPENFCRDLQNANWQNVYETNDPNEAYRYFFPDFR